nr:preprotein translocase subunit YajC [uncultured Ruminococcus sp.]
MANAFSGGNLWLTILMWGGLLVVFYFLLIRPNSKKQKREQEMRNNIAIGDDITTIGGIQGRIIAVKEDEDAFVIETGPDRTKMKFKKWAISSVDTVKDTPETAKKSFTEKLAERKAAKEAAKEEKEAQKNNE